MIVNKLSELPEEWPEMLVVGYHHLLFLNREKTHKLRAGQDFFSVTWDDEHLIYTEAPVRDRAQARLLRLDSTGKLKRGEQVGQYVHQCLHAKGQNYVVDTLNNKIQILSKEGKHLQTIDWINKHTKEEDRHINSIWCDGDTFWICEHWQGHRQSCLRQFDKDWTEIDAVDIGLKNHNVYVENHKLYTLSSEESAIIIFDLKSRTDERVEFDPTKYGLPANATWLRGFSRIKDRFLIGVSIFDKNRAARANRPCWVLMFDNNFNLLDGVKLHQKFGPISEIRVTSVPDYAHTGQVFPFPLPIAQKK